MQPSGKVDSLIIPPPPPQKPPASWGVIIAGLLALVGVLLAVLALLLFSRQTGVLPVAAVTSIIEPTLDTGALTLAAENQQIALAAAVETAVEQKLGSIATQTAAVSTVTPPAAFTATDSPTVTLSPTMTPGITRTPVNELVISPLAGADTPFVYVGSIRGLTLVVYALNRGTARTLTMNASYGGFVLLQPGIYPDSACSQELQNPLELRFQEQPAQVIYCAPEGRGLRNPVQITAQDNTGKRGWTSLELRRDVLSVNMRQVATALENIACPYEPAAGQTTPPLNIIPLAFHLEAQDETVLPRSYHVTLAPQGSFQIYNPEEDCRSVRSDSIFAMLERDLVAYFVFPPDGDNSLPTVALSAAGDFPALTGDPGLTLQPMMVSLLDEQILVLSEPDTTSPPLRLPLMEDSIRLGRGQSLIITGQDNEWLLVETNRGTGYIRNFGSLVGIVGELPGE